MKFMLRLFIIFIIVAMNMLIGHTACAGLPAAEWKWLTSGWDEVPNNSGWGVDHKEIFNWDPIDDYNDNKGGTLFTYTWAKGAFDKHGVSLINNGYVSRPFIIHAKDYGNDKKPEKALIERYGHIDPYLYAYNNVNDDKRGSELRGRLEIVGKDQMKFGPYTAYGQQTTDPEPQSDWENIELSIGTPYTIKATIYQKSEAFGYRKSSWAENYLPFHYRLKDTYPKSPNWNINITEFATGRIGGTLKYNAQIQNNSPNYNLYFTPVTPILPEGLKDAKWTPAGKEFKVGPGDTISLTNPPFGQLTLPSKANILPGEYVINIEQPAFGPEYYDPIAKVNRKDSAYPATIQQKVTARILPPVKPKYIHKKTFVDPNLGEFIMDMTDWYVLKKSEREGQAVANVFFYNNEERAKALATAGLKSGEHSGGIGDGTIDFWRYFKLSPTSGRSGSPIPKSIPAYMRIRMQGGFMGNPNPHEGEHWSSLNVFAEVQNSMGGLLRSFRTKRTYKGDDIRWLERRYKRQFNINLGENYLLHGRLSIRSEANAGKNNYAAAEFWNSVDVTPVPEPCTMLLMGSGLAGLAGIARRRRRQQ